MHLPVTFRVPLAAVAATSFFLSALPGTAGELSDRVVATLTASPHLKVTHDAVSESGSTVTLEKLTFTVTEEGNEIKLAVPQFIVENVQLTDDGGFRADRVTADNMALVAAEVTGTIGKASSTNIVAKSPDKIKTLGKSANVYEYGTTEVSDIKINAPDGIVIPIDRVFISAQDYVEGIPTKSDYKLENLVLEIKKILEAEGDQQSVQNINKLGYERFVINSSGSYTWEPQSGQLTTDDVVFDISDVGKLTLGFSIGGMTAEKMNQLSEMSESKPQELIGVLQGFTLGNLDIEFDDSSVTNRILEMQAQEVGVDRNAFVGMLKGGLSPMLGYFQDPKFQQDVSSAVGTFLDDPKSIRIAAKPAQPMMFGAIFGAAMAAPQSIPSMIGFDITAN